MTEEEPDTRHVRRQDEPLNHAPNEVPLRPSTLLPRPFASAVSLATATSSLALRIGGGVGHAAIDGARIGTLTSIELGRVLIEGILFRARGDVIDISRGEKGKEEAEGVIQRVLSNLHYTITSTSFLISAAFQIGSTSLESGLALSRMFLSGLDAILGDTDTSKAVAAIVLLIQREAKNQETVIGGQKTGLTDLMVGTTAFALLQRWGRKKTDQEYVKLNVTELVWDVVVINDGNDNRAGADTSPDAYASTAETAEPALQTRRRAASFVSATGDHEPLQGTGDGVSFVSANSTWTSAPSTSTNHILYPAEENFRQKLTSGLTPGTSVRLTADSVTRDRVMVEVYGESDPQLEAPAGFNLLAVNRQSQGEDSATFIFQRLSRKRRHGGFEVEDQSPYIETTLQEDVPGVVEDSDEFNALNRITSTEQNLEEAGRNDMIEPSGVQEMNDPVVSVSDNNSDPALVENTPVTANQKRTRSPMILRADRPISSSYMSTTPALDKSSRAKLSGNKFSKASQNQSPLRKAMNKSKSVKNLVEFWSKERQNDSKNRNEVESDGKTQRQDVTNGLAHSNNEMTAPLEPNETVALEGVQSRDWNGNLGQYLREPRPSSSVSHRRNQPSTYSIESNASESSLMLRPLFVGNEIEEPVSFLHRDGTLASQYPQNSFTFNVARFARFSIAAYGSNFLRWTASVSGSELTSLTDSADLPEHHSFSTYTNLPSSTVLLSSYVDAQPPINASAASDSDSIHGLPLVHYISLDHASKAVVLTCRGTLGFEDILTDVTCDYTTISWQSMQYEIHQGIYTSAKRIMTTHGGRVLATLKSALEEFPEYALILCGHSLGGAVAAVLAVLLAQPSTTSTGGAARFVTTAAALHDALALPPNRPIHAYAFGPAACVSHDLQRATRGLVTTVVLGADIVPTLSLGTLRDLQAVAAAFKADSRTAKAQLARRVWEGLTRAVRDGIGGGGGAAAWVEAPSWGQQDDAGAHADADDWAWSALKSLRASLLADKLVPPGDVYAVDAAPVLQRHAFVSGKKGAGGAGAQVEEEEEGGGGRGGGERRSFRPATRITLRHVRDVERRFGELRFAAGMFGDHFPGRYLSVLEGLDAAIGA